jgi:lipopolysaccharide transport system ATP-binding protein
MVGDLPVVSVEGVSKKFCRSLKRSLWYGVQDLAGELIVRDRSGTVNLRPGEFLAVQDVSFQLRRGECLGLVGANGAGKSTLLKMLNGLIRPDAGRIAIRGRVRALIELGTGFNPILTGRENVYVNGAVLGLSKSEIDARFDQIVDFAELREFIDSPVQSYSSGMHVRLAMAVAASMQAEFLLVDEVLAVGDVAFRMKCFRHFLDLKSSGKTIVVVSHNMIDIHRVCDRVIVLDGGKNIHDGDVSSGVATYEDLLIKRCSRTSQRSLNAAAWLDSIKLLDPQGRPKENFDTGDDLVAEVSLSAVRKVTNARLIVHVMTPSLGTLGAFSSPYSGFSFDILPPGNIVRFTLRAVPLLIGSYTLGVSLYGPGITDFLDANSTAASFKIIAPAVDTFGFGECYSVQFRHEWELVEKSQTAPNGTFGR